MMIDFSTPRPAFGPAGNTDLQQQLRIADGLRDLLHQANAHRAHEDGVTSTGTYTAIQRALLVCITNTLVSQGWSRRKATSRAREVMDLAVESGESITFCWTLSR